jgi:hypothetical protein
LLQERCGIGVQLVGTRYPPAVACQTAIFFSFKTAIQLYFKLQFSHAFSTSNGADGYFVGVVKPNGSVARQAAVSKIFCYSFSVCVVVVDTSRLECCTCHPLRISCPAQVAVMKGSTAYAQLGDEIISVDGVAVAVSGV